MSCNGWKRVKLEDVINFNPKESIKKGKVVKKISMDKLETFTRKISGYEECAFTSGTKFRNGDTLLARITPCLENGKTAQVDILEEDEVAYGSTEFIVLREKEGVTLNNYIYYLAISPQFRQIAIKSMNGSSGRQRVQKDILDKTEMYLPCIEEQKKISDVLCSLDTKIELNNEMNKTLEEMAQALFKRWFVDFEFPDEEGKPYKSSGGEMIESEMGMIPKGWKVVSLKEIVLSANTGADAIRRAPIVEYDTGIKCVRVGDLSNKRDFSKWSYCEISEQDYNRFKLEKDDIVVTRTATIGLNDFIYEDLKAVYNNGLIRLKVKGEFSSLFIYQVLNYKDYYNYISKITGETSTRPNMKINYLLDYKFVLPLKEIRNNFEKTIKLIYGKIYAINKENNKLLELRDLLLPKLMSGEIRVNDIEANL